MTVVSLPGALEDRLRVLPHGGDLALAVHDPHDPEGRDVDARGRGRGDGHEVLRVGVQVLLEGVDDELTRLAVELGHGAVDGLDQGVGALAADVVEVVGVHAEHGDTGKAAQDGVLGLGRHNSLKVVVDISWSVTNLDLETGVIVEGDPGLVVEGVGAGLVLLALQSPVALLQVLADLLKNESKMPFTI